MNASIIICTRNRPQSLDETLESLNRIQTPPGIQAEVLIVDNGPSEQTAVVAKKWREAKIPTRYAPEPRTGQSRARNTGMEQSRGEVIIFTDDDLRFPEDWLEGMCWPIAEKKADAVAGQVKLAPHLERNWMTRRHRAWLAASERFEAGPATDMIGANMSFSRNVLYAVSAFDPELGPGALGYGDDTLFAWQILRSGKKIQISRSAPVVHHFDEKRLLRTSWLQAAKNFGRSAAYLAYHWRHESKARPALKYYQAVAGYYARRILRSADCASSEGMTEWELSCLQNLNFFEQYARQSGSPRHYKLHGLVKLGDGESVALKAVAA